MLFRSDCFLMLVLPYLKALYLPDSRVTAVLLLSAVFTPVFYHGLTDQNSELYSDSTGGIWTVFFKENKE